MSARRSLRSSRKDEAVACRLRCSMPAYLRRHWPGWRSSHRRQRFLGRSGRVRWQRVASCGRSPRSIVDAWPSIPVRIHVAGTRGKSATVRLIAPACERADTASSPRLRARIRASFCPTERSGRFARWGAAAIREQRALVAAAHRVGANAVVAEAMAIEPEYLNALERFYVRATDLVDHQCSPGSPGATRLRAGRDGECRRRDGAYRRPGVPDGGSRRSRPARSCGRHQVRGGDGASMKETTRRKPISVSPSRSADVMASPPTIASHAMLLGREGYWDVQHRHAASLTAAGSASPTPSPATTSNRSSASGAITSPRRRARHFCSIRAPTDRSDRGSSSSCSCGSRRRRRLFIMAEIACCAGRRSPPVSPESRASSASTASPRIPCAGGRAASQQGTVVWGCRQFSRDEAQSCPKLAETASVRHADPDARHRRQVSLALVELTGITAGAIIAPGYIALLLDQPRR